MSVPAKESAAPGATGRRTSTTRPPSSRSVSSTGTTASAPRGSMPPVAIALAVPAATSTRGHHARRDRLRVDAQAHRRLFRCAVRCPPRARRSRPCWSGRSPARRPRRARPRPARGRGQRRARPPRRRAARRRSPRASAARPRRGRAPRGTGSASRRALVVVEQHLDLGALGQALEPARHDHGAAARTVEDRIDAPEVASGTTWPSSIATRT